MPTNRTLPTCNIQGIAPTRTPLRSQRETPIHPPQIPQQPSSTVRPQQHTQLPLPQFPEPIRDQHVIEAQEAWLIAHSQRYQHAGQPQQAPVQAQPQPQPQQPRLQPQPPQPQITTFSMRQDQDDPVYHTINDADYQHNQLNVTGSQSWYDWQREEENERRKRKFEETQRAVQERARLKRREKSRAGSDGGGNEQSPEAEEDGDDSDLQATIPTFCQEVTPLQLPTIRPTLMLGPYQTREAATEAVMEYAIAQGYMLVLSATAKEKPLKGQFESDMPVIRVDMMCDRGGVCKSHGTGKRKRTTHRIGCPARMKLVSRKRDCYQWVIQIVCEQHNHNLSPGDMEGFATYRRWRRKQAGKPAAESAEDRSARRKRMNPPKPKPAPSVPAPVFHSLATPLPPALPPATEKTSPIHMAALKGQGKILEILLNKGADVNGIDASGRTPLHCGVESGKMDIIRLLLERGADVTKLTTKGVSVLQLAVEKALEDAVVMFIESGADPNI